MSKEIETVGEIEFGYDSFSEEEKKVLKKVGKEIVDISGISIKDLAMCFNECFKKRDIYKNASPAVKHIVEMGGIFIPVDILYPILLYLAVFSVDDDTTEMLNEAVDAGRSAIEQALKIRKETK